MAQMNLKSDFRTDEEIEYIKQHIMKWYDGDDSEIGKKCFYQDALEDVLSWMIYGHYGDYRRAAMLLGNWMCEWKENHPEEVEEEE